MFPYTPLHIEQSSLSFCLVAYSTFTYYLIIQQHESAKTPESYAVSTLELLE